MAQAIRRAASDMVIGAGHGNWVYMIIDTMPFE